MSIGSSWEKVLDLEAIETAIKWSENLRFTEKIYPASEEVFRAFELCPYEKVKVVIMGQDPYPGTDRVGIPHAHGLAFSSQSSEVPKSLQNVFKELAQEFGRPTARRNSDLTDWAEQGVLLLNSALTVQAGKPNSHQGKYWNPVIKSTIIAVSQLPHVVFMLWGNDALQIYPFIKNRGNHLILEAVHPSPMSAHRGFFGCNHFITANRWLDTHDIDPIHWI